MRQLRVEVIHSRPRHISVRGGHETQPISGRLRLTVVEVGVLLVVGITACVGVGAGLGGMALSTGGSRVAFGAAIALSLVGLGCAVAALG